MEQKQRWQQLKVILDLRKRLKKTQKAAVTVVSGYSVKKSEKADEVNMIDERKMKMEIEELMQTVPEGTIEHRILQIFLAYINRQQVIDFMTLLFYERMSMYHTMVSAGKGDV